jgi:hypothetical protein
VHITAPRLPPVALHSEKKRPGQGLSGAPAMPRPGPGYYCHCHCHRAAAVGRSSSGSAGHWLQWQAGSLSGIQVATGSSSSGRSLGKVVASLFLHSSQIGP